MQTHCPRSSIVGLLLAVLAVLGASCDGASKSATQPERETGFVEKIVDGDTLWIRVGDVTEKTRLVLIDTPETVDPNRGVECFGPEATAAITRLLPVGTRVRIERAEDERDRYDRLLALVWRASDNLLINRELVDRGFARVLVIAPNTKGAAGFRMLEEVARGDKRGLWGACPQSQ